MYQISETTLLSTLRRPDDHSTTIAIARPVLTLAQTINAFYITHTHTHTHPFYSFTHNDTGALNLYYLPSHEHTILSVPISIIIFMNEYFVILI